MTKKRLITGLLFTAIAGSGLVWWYLASPAKPHRDRTVVSQVVKVTQWTADGLPIIDGIALESGKSYLIDTRFVISTIKLGKVSAEFPGHRVAWVWVRFASNALRNRFASKDDLHRAVQVIGVSRAQPIPTRMTVPVRLGEYELQLVVSTSEDASLPPEMYQHGHVVASAMIRVVSPK